MFFINYAEDIQTHSSKKYHTYFILISTRLRGPSIEKSIYGLLQILKPQVEYNPNQPIFLLWFQLEIGSPEVSLGKGIGVKTHLNTKREVKMVGLGPL